MRSEPTNTAGSVGDMRRKMDTQRIGSRVKLDPGGRARLGGKTVRDFGSAKIQKFFSEGWRGRIDRE